jgi:hypothetical protein
VIQRIVAGWPRGISAKRAERLGLAADRTIDEIVQAFIEDDLPAQRVLAGTG